VIGFEGAAFDDALARTPRTRPPADGDDPRSARPQAFVTIDPDAVLVNVARGPVVETDALVEALRSNWIRGASLDVTDPEPLPEEHPLWTFENVQITPHNAGHTPQYYDRLADIVAENVTRIDDDGADADLENQVLPDR